nr:hypothetical protein [uncultured Campylobacter sp.]
MNIYDSVIASNGKGSIRGYLQNNANKSLDTFKDLLNKAEKTDTTGVDAIKEAKESLGKAVNKNDELATTFKKLEAQVKKDEEMFKTFDFMQLSANVWCK